MLININPARNPSCNSTDHLDYKYRYVIVRYQHMIPLILLSFFQVRCIKLSFLIQYVFNHTLYRRPVYMHIEERQESDNSYRRLFQKPCLINLINAFNYTISGSNNDIVFFWYLSFWVSEEPQCKYSKDC